MGQGPGKGGKVPWNGASSVAWVWNQSDHWDVTVSAAFVWTTPGGQWRAKGPFPDKKLSWSLMPPWEDTRGSRVVGPLDLRCLQQGWLISESYLEFLPHDRSLRQFRGTPWPPTWVHAWGPLGLLQQCGLQGAMASVSLCPDPRTVVGLHILHPYL